ncbi:MAG: helix-turn-helix domain-containing protein [Thermomicrobiales bacterium]
MATTLDSELLTIAETAALLKVDRSTVRRWIDQGTLPAYRVGQRAVRVRRDDVTKVITPARSPLPEDDEFVRFKERKMTPDEQVRWREAIDELQRVREYVSKLRGGKRFSPSWEIINEMRDERTEQLWEAATGSRYEGDEESS